MRRIIGVMAGVVALMACSGGETKDVGGATEQPLGWELRVRGTAPGGFQAINIFPETVQVFADGVPVRSRATGDLVNLADPNHATLVATFDVPEGAQRVTFRVGLGAAGSVESAGSSDWLDTRNTELTFEISGAELLRRDRAVVAIDTAASLVTRPEEAPVFVPKYRVY